MRSLGDTNRYGHMNRIAYMQEKQARLAEYSASRYSAPQFKPRNNSNSNQAPETNQTTEVVEASQETASAETEVVEAQTVSTPVETIETVRPKSEKQEIKEALSAEIEALSEAIKGPQYIEEVVWGEQGANAACPNATPYDVNVIEVERDLKDDLAEAQRIRDLITESPLSVRSQNELKSDMKEIFQYLDDQIQSEIASLETRRNTIGEAGDEDEEEVRDANREERNEINAELMDWMVQSQSIQREISTINANYLSSQVFGR